MEYGITVIQAAKELGISKHKVRALIREGYLAAIALGRRYLIHPAELSRIDTALKTNKLIKSSCSHHFVPDVLSIPQAAKYKGVTKQTISNWIRAGRLPLEPLSCNAVKIDNLNKIALDSQSSKEHEAINNKGLLTINQAIEIKGVSRARIESWLNSGLLPYTRMFRYRVVDSTKLKEIPLAANKKLKPIDFNAPKLLAAHGKLLSLEDAAKLLGFCKQRMTPLIRSGKLPYVQFSKVYLVDPKYFELIRATAPDKVAEATEQLHQHVGNYLTVQQAARLKNVSTGIIFSAIYAKRLNVERFGKIYAIRKTSLDNFQMTKIGRPRKVISLS